MDKETPECPVKKKSEFNQPYNEDWEKLPIFQGWLSPVPDKKFRAKCTYCDKEFRAHRTDLRTHAQSRKHMRAADARFIYEEYRNDFIVNENHSRSYSEDSTSIPKHKYELSSPGAASSQPILVTIPIVVPKIKEENNQYIISTQVQDTVKGVPVDRLVVFLFVLRGNEWIKFGKGVTEKDGSCSKFVKLNENDDKIVPGQYKLRYETKMHFTLNLDETIFPFIEVTFDVVDLTDHYQVNLLISPYGYMVFKKS